MSLDDFDDDLTVPMRPTNHQPNQPPPPRPQPAHLDDFDDDLTVPMRPTNHQPNQPPPLAAVRVEPPGPPVAAPGAADLWIPPPRPTRTTGPADSLDGIAWWKVAVAATAALAVGVAAFVMLAGGGDGDGSNGQTPAAVEGQ